MLVDVNEFWVQCEIVRTKSVHTEKPDVIHIRRSVKGTLLVTYTAYSETCSLHLTHS